jgi:hypothetical protein
MFGGIVRNYNWIMVLLIMLFSSGSTAYAFNENHPYLYLTQTQLDALKAMVNSGASNYVTDAFRKMKNYGDSQINSAPQFVNYIGDDPAPELKHYKIGHTDSEKATAWAISYNVELDPVKKMAYANKAKEFVMTYMSGRMDCYLSCIISYEINMLIIYDLTFSSGLYSSEDRNKVHSHVYSKILNPTWCENPADGSWNQNMSHWECGLFAMRAIMYDDETIIARAFNQFKRRINATDSDGRFYDYWHRDLAYNNYTLSPMLHAAQAAKNTGRHNWWSYEGAEGRSLELSVDFLTTPEHTANGNSWVPTMYGNLEKTLNTNGKQNSGEYATGLTQNFTSDQRWVFELALSNIDKQKYRDTLNDSSGDRNPRGSIFNYHTHYWLPTFLNVDKLGDVPSTEPSPPTGLLVQ